MKNTNPKNRYWGSQSPPKSKSEFFNAITTPAPTGDGTIATVRLYGPIDSWGGYWGISAQDVSEILDALPESVTQIILRINSPGGEMFEGISILNLLRAHRATVTAVVDGLAASAATIISSGSDEVVMSPGTQMMIHSPWMFTYGNAADLRKMADTLDGFEASIVEIYEAKAGTKDWAALLADETWWTAAQAVEEGLADRVAVVPDAGETATVGDATDSDDETSDVDVVEDRTPVRIVARASSPHMPPSSTEPGDSNREEDVVSYDSLKAGLRERLGVTDAAASDEQLLLTLEDQLTTPTASAAPELPAGAMVVDKGAWDELQAKAQAGADASAALNQQRRDGVLAKALEEGRIAPSTKDDWRASLDSDEASTTKLLASLPKNTVPVTEMGHAIDRTEDDAAYAMAWGDEKAS